MGDLSKGAECPHLRGVPRGGGCPKGRELGQDNNNWYIHVRQLSEFLMLHEFNHFCPLDFYHIHIFLTLALSLVIDSFLFL